MTLHKTKILLQSEANENLGIDSDFYWEDATFYLEDVNYFFRHKEKYVMIDFGYANQFILNQTYEEFSLIMQNLETEQRESREVRD